jgi:hypothetical protein
MHKSDAITLPQRRRPRTQMEFQPAFYKFKSNLAGPAMLLAALERPFEEEGDVGWKESYLRLSVPCGVGALRAAGCGPCATMLLDAAGCGGGRPNRSLSD